MNSLSVVNLFWTLLYCKILYRIVSSLCVRVCDHTDESMRLHCEFDISVGAPADDIRDAVCINFYSIAIMK